MASDRRDVCAGFDGKPAGHADARPRQPAAIQVTRVITVRHPHAPRRCGVVRIGCAPLEYTEKRGGVGHGPRHRPGGVLVCRDGNNPVPADTTHRRLDADQHRLIGGSENRARCFGADVGGPEIRRCSGTRAGTSGAERRPAVAGSLTRVAARIVRIEAVAHERVVVAGHPRRHPIGQLCHVRLRDDDGPSFAKEPGDGRFVRRNESLERERSACRRHVDRVDIVLEGDRDAMQRAPHPALRRARDRAHPLLRAPAD